jgi:hypothetical protein
MKIMVILNDKSEAYFQTNLSIESINEMLTNRVEYLALNDGIVKVNNISYIQSLEEKPLDLKEISVEDLVNELVGRPLAKEEYEKYNQLLNTDFKSIPTKELAFELYRRKLLTEEDFLEIKKLLESSELCDSITKSTYI